jgi:hypothetical protein
MYHLYTMRGWDVVKQICEKGLGKDISKTGYVLGVVAAFGCLFWTLLTALDSLHNRPQAGKAVLLYCNTCL